MSVGLRNTRADVLVRAGSLSNLKNCGVSNKLFLLLTLKPFVKVFYSVNCIVSFACLMFYFSNSFLIVSYNCDTMILMLDTNQVGLCCSLLFLF